jgi:RNA polymerase sigma factor (sigma-70 family)
LAAVPSVGRAAQLEHPAGATADATRSLYERFAGQIYGYCLHQLGSREEAEDAVQTTFLNVFRGLKRGIVPEIESAWLFKIAHNVCLSRRRSSHRRGRVETPNNMEVLQEVVPARERGNEDLIRLQDALEVMPESQRRAILLREWQGLSYREIADELRLSQSAVETLIFRARRTLAAGLAEAPPEERTWRARARYSIDAGGIATAFKAVLGGGSAIKAAATIAAVATTAVAVSDETTHHAFRHVPPAPPPPVRIAHDPAPVAPERTFSSLRGETTMSRRSAIHGSAAHAAKAVTYVTVPPAARGTGRPEFGSPPAPAHPAHPTHPTHPLHPATPAVAAPTPTAAPTPPASASHGKGHVKHDVPAVTHPAPAPPAAEVQPAEDAGHGRPPDKPDNAAKPDNGNGNGHK